MYMVESSVAVEPGALKRGLGRAGKPARLVFKDYFHVMPFRTRPHRGPSPGFSPPGTSDAFSRYLASVHIFRPHLAEDLKHKRKVAVKVLRPELAAVLEAEWFVQEINTTANLKHPHIFRKRHNS